MIDCVLAGSCVIDVIVRPVDLDAPLGAGRLIRSDPLVLATGGIVSNAGITMARLGAHPLVLQLPIGVEDGFESRWIELRATAGYIGGTLGW